MHEGLVITRFRAPVSLNVAYETSKAKALVKHLRTVADLVERKEFVAKCPLARERPWVSLQEWENPITGDREGQWETDVSVAVPGCDPVVV